MPSGLAVPTYMIHAPDPYSDITDCLGNDVGIWWHRNLKLGTTAIGVRLHVPQRLDNFSGATHRRRLGS
jgi:hypothetical protein